MKGWIAFGCFAFIGIIVLMMWGCPNYNVWSASKEGEAELRKAEMNKQILVLEADAKSLAAEADARAEVIRAQGMADAMEIENGMLTDLYIRYLFVRTLNELPSGTQVIYLPADGFLPLNEAGRR